MSSPKEHRAEAERLLRGSKALLEQAQSKGAGMSEADFTAMTFLVSLAGVHATLSLGGERWAS